MTLATAYLERLRRATSPAEEMSIAQDYQAYRATLPAAEQAEADCVMGVLWPTIWQKVADLDALVAEFE